ncbi:glycosyltransferase family 4 protein [Brumimicrobium oceani]|uniref:Glycosyl transferase family 1 n=1 Tax=Brumimicrobium oceani TaxID=2100725 RepID=A0A2U2XBY9_9FLAO|nr:glycosyltransferase family 4 protein [Brumimicrobium oceani]PWH85319.1 glycosyl transferase family 1 [Brumimicrobium oceani]
MKITTILFSIDKAKEFEWYIDEIDRNRFEISFISINEKEETHLKEYCEAHNVPFYHVSYQSKKDILQAIFKTRKILKKLKPNIVHSHIFEGGLIGVTAAWLAGVKNRIYTRHYSDFHHVYYPNGLKYDKWINSKATHIVAVSEVVKSILIEKENVPSKKVSVIHHGIKNIDDSDTTIYDRILKVKQKNSIPNSKIVIGVISRYTKLKGLQYIIPAFENLLETQPNLHLVLANAKGEFKSEIDLMLRKIPKSSYTEILFENDSEALFKVFDVFVHVPVSRESEAFGQIYIEALKFGIPSIFSLSGIANEFIKDEENALVVKHESAEDIKLAVERLLKDDKLCENLIKNGKEAVKGFTTMKKTKALEALYLKIGS